MRRTGLSMKVVFAGLAAVMAAGCASMDQPSSQTAQAPKMTPAQSVEARQKLMKEHGDLWKSIQDKTKAGDITGVAPDADKLAMNAKKIAPLFPAGSLEGKTAAKPEIWQKWPEFEAAAKNLEMESVKLRDTAKANDKPGTEALVKDFGRKACGSCHQPFRVPPPRTS
jgi:cytochrome c556